LRPTLPEDEVVEAFKDLVGLSRQEVERDTDVVLLSCCPGPEGVTRSSALRPLLLVLLWARLVASTEDRQGCQYQQDTDRYFPSPSNYSAHITRFVHSPVQMAQEDPRSGGYRLL
jgi:hypothetical protein